MRSDTKQVALNRLASIEGHLRGIRKMIEDDQYCVDVLKQFYAVQRALEKLEAVVLRGHMQTCVIAGIKDGREDAVVDELTDLYELSRR